MNELSKSLRHCSIYCRIVNLEGFRVTFNKSMNKPMVLNRAKMQRLDDVSIVITFQCVTILVDSIFPEPVIVVLTGSQHQNLCVA